MSSFRCLKKVSLDSVFVLLVYYKPNFLNTLTDMELPTKSKKSNAHFP